MNTGLETREQLFAVMERIAEEREIARPIVHELVTRGSSVDDIEIPEGWRTAGMVMELSSSAEAIEEARPSHSLSLQQLGLALMTTVSSVAYPQIILAYLEGRLWREISWLHRYQNAYSASIAAADAALSAFGKQAVLLHDQAITKQMVSGPLAFAGQHIRAFELIDESADILREFGDERRLTIGEVLKAAYYFNRGDFGLARNKYEELLATAQTSDDRRTAAAILHNFAAASVQSGRPNDAIEPLQRARAIYAELGLSVDRTDWVFAAVLLACGDAENALPLLRSVRQSFLLNRMPEDAGLVGLDIVDALLATGKWDEALRLTESVVNEFRDANLSIVAIRALAYLRDLLPSSIKPRGVVKYVRSFVERLRHNPALVFLPLDDDQQ
jgi:tetratricopeptide (TPR) repeat protein